MVTFSSTSDVLESYRTWNARLLKYALSNGVDAEGRFFLVVRQMLEDEPDPHDAEARFVAAVRNQYANLLMLNPVGWLRQRSGERDEPLCVALLGLSVLAAERMNDNRYYEHLASLLGQPQEGSSVHGFDRQAYLGAWEESLADYLRCRYGYTLLEPDANGMTFVSWPRAHALLRAVDRHKLPHLFKAFGFAPTQAVTRKSVESAVSRWLALPGYRPTDAGRRACADPVRRPGIIQQVVRALEQWDGTVPAPGEGWGGSGQARTAEARLVVLDPGARRMRLRLRTKRPDGFPESAMLYGLQLKAFDSAAYYDDIEVPPPWNGAIRQGMQTAWSGKRITFRGAEAFALARSEAGYTGYEGSPSLRMGVPCAVLCLTVRAEETAAYLRRVCDKDARRRDLNAGELPGWTLFDGFVPVRNAPVPPRLDALAVESKLLIRPIGGLRLGHDRTWMHGAPPRAIEVWGANPPQELYINGALHLLEPGKQGDPWVLEHPFGDDPSPGEYSVVAGASAYHLRVIAPRLCAAAKERREASESNEPFQTDCDEPARADGERNDLQRAAGWKRIGRPDGVGDPCWAVGKANGRAAVVALRQPATMPTGRPTPGWSSLVLRAAHARIGILEAARSAEQGPNEERRRAVAAWRAYVAAAVREERRNRPRRQEKP